MAKAACASAYEMEFWDPTWPATSLPARLGSTSHIDMDQNTTFTIAGVYMKYHCCDIPVQLMLLGNQQGSMDSYQFSR